MSQTIITAGIQATVNQLQDRGACKTKLIRTLREVADEMEGENDGE